MTFGFSRLPSCAAMARGFLKKSRLAASIFLDGSAPRIINPNGQQLQDHRSFLLLLPSLLPASIF